MSSWAKLEIRVQPGAKKNEVVGEVDGVVKIKIAAPPVEGKANRELIAFLAKKLGLKKNEIKIESGEKSRLKIIRIEGMNKQKAMNILLGKD